MIALMFFSQFGLADSLYAGKYFDLAAVEYRRAFFFYPESNQDPAPRIKFALALVRNNEPRGFEELEKVRREFADIPVESKVAIARCYLREGSNYTAAEILAETGEHRLTGYALLSEGRFAEARDFFVTHEEPALAGEVNEYLKKKKKSVLLATVLSICPGAGEIYAGKTKRGIIDFLLSAGTGYFMYDAFREKRYVDAGLIFSFLFNRFYAGSMANAQRSALDRNEDDRLQWFDHIREKYYPDIDF